MKQKEFTMNIPAHYYDERVLNQIDKFIADGYKKYSDLGECEKSDLVACVIDALGNDGYEFILDDSSLHIVLHHFKKYLKTAKSEYKSDLAVTLKKIALDYHGENLRKRYTERATQLARIKTNSKAKDNFIDMQIDIAEAA